jgi:hypothetical protein
MLLLFVAPASTPLSILLLFVLLFLPFLVVSVVAIIGEPLDHVAKFMTVDLISFCIEFFKLLPLEFLSLQFFLEKAFRLNYG